MKTLKMVLLVLAMGFGLAACGEQENEIFGETSPQMKKNDGQAARAPWRSYWNLAVCTGNRAVYTQMNGKEFTFVLNNQQRITKRCNSKRFCRANPHTASRVFCR